MRTNRFIIVIFIIMLIVIFPMTVKASDTGINPEDYAVGKIEQEDVGTLATMTGNILATIRTIGVLASVIVLSIIGVKYMFGSLQEKADYKQDLFTYVFGCLLLMMATTIPSIIYDMMN